MHIWCSFFSFNFPLCFTWITNNKWHVEEKLHIFYFAFPANVSFIYINQIGVLFIFFLSFMFSNLENDHIHIIVFVLLIKLLLYRISIWLLDFDYYTYKILLLTKLDLITSFFSSYEIKKYFFSAVKFFEKICTTKLCFFFWNINKSKYNSAQNKTVVFGLFVYFFIWFKWDAVWSCRTGARPQTDNIWLATTIWATIAGTDNNWLNKQQTETRRRWFERKNTRCLDDVLI